MENFLFDIYKRNCSKGDYVMLSARKGKTWIDHPIKFKRETLKGKINQFFDKYPPEEWDLYFSPHPYSGPRRLTENAIETKFLAQDIDECTNPEDLPIQPSYIWESSPNKYQGLWELDRYINEKQYTPLNEAFCDYIDADDGCWEFVHVYRIPGTVNHKYKDMPEVSEARYTKEIYRPKTLTKLVKPQKQETTQVKDIETSDIQERKIYAKYSIPQKVRDLLALDSLDGIDRSNTIWYLENKLFELGMEANEIIHLIKNSVFNKYKDRKDQDKRLKRELEKIISGKVLPKDDSGEDSFEVSTYQDVMSNPRSFSGWMVKGFWGRASHGMVAGMPKTMKSTMVQDFAVSIASGKPFLGKYEVIEQGPVLIVQNENADYIMRDRNEKMITNKGLTGNASIKRNKLKVEFAPDLPIYFINQQGFSISNDTHKKKLEKKIEQIKPVLVIFDPLYLMFEGDLNSGSDINPALNWLLSLKKKYDTSVMLIHHYNKGGLGTPQRGGARMAGSVFLYGWIESAWYLQRDEIEEEVIAADASPDESSIDPTVVMMDREFRFAGHYPNLDLHVAMGEIGNPYYDVDVRLSGHDIVPNIRDIATVVLDAMKDEEPLSIGDISSKSNLSRKDVRSIINQLTEQKKVGVKGGKYYIYK